MKTIHVRLPRPGMDLADTITAVEWNASAINVFVQCLDSLHSCINDIFSFEILLHQGRIHFCFTGSEQSVDIIAAIVLAVYDSAELETIQDQTHIVNDTIECAVGELQLKKDSIYPLWVYPHKKDPMLPLFEALSSINKSESAMVQFVACPIVDNTKLHCEFVRRRSSDAFKQLVRPKYWFKRGIREDVCKQILKKQHSRMFDLNIRIAAWREESPRSAGQLASQQTVSRIFSAMTYVNKSDINGIRLQKVSHGHKALKPVQDRLLSRPFMLSSPEFSTLFHIPWASSIKHSDKVMSYKAAPPADLTGSDTPVEGIEIGLSNFRERHTPVVLSPADRTGHLYVSGLTGTGKSSLLQMMAAQDITHGNAVAVFDPHGRLIDEVLRTVPASRVEDVILFDPLDSSFPISFNPLKKMPLHAQGRIASDYSQFFQSMLNDTWNDQISYLLTNTLLALFNTKGATLLSAEKLLTSSRYRNEISRCLPHESVKQFWKSDYEPWSSQFYKSAVAPLKDLFNQLVSNKLIRNVLCQPVSRLKLGQVIDDRKILLVKLPAQIIGDDICGFLGKMIYTRLHLEAMSKAALGPGAPNPLYLYVDELNRFAHHNFCHVLSESRKIGINLTLASQSFHQIPHKIQQEILGNITNLLCLRTDTRDAQIFANEFQSKFEVEDLTQQRAREFIVKMSINEAVQPPFTGQIADLSYPDRDLSKLCIESSRSLYATPVSYASSVMEQWETPAH